MRGHMAICALLLVAACGGDVANHADATMDATSDTMPDSGDDGTVDDADTAVDVPDIPDMADSADDAAIDDVPDDGDTATHPDSDEGPGWVEIIATREVFDALKGAGDEVKYLARVDGREPPAGLETPCIFQDMGRWAWHIEFLRTFRGLETLSGAQYSALVLNRMTRGLWGGGVVERPNALHPLSGARGIFVYSVYGEARPGSVTADDIVEVDTRLKGCMPFAAENLVFVASGFEQQQLLQSAGPQLATLGIATVSR